MQNEKWIFISLLTTFLWSEPLEMTKLNGAWHLRIMDGMEVRKARAILDFDININKTILSGFDGCNRIEGTIQKKSAVNLNVPLLISTKMACREPIHSWVSKRLHQALNEGFSIKEEEKYNIVGITLKSAHHELFFKKMQRD